MSAGALQLGDGGDDDCAIKVAVRVRPPLPQECVHGFKNVIRVHNDQKTVTISESFIDDSSTRVDGFSIYNSHQLTFDYAFGMDSTQEEIYEKVASGAIQNVLEGYNATVMAYGQTSSGKTYTMGGESTSVNPGIIPRAVNSIFNYISSLTNERRRFLVRASYLQIYNEVILDLLSDNNRPLKIRESKQRGVYVEGLSEFVVRSPQEVYALIEKGGKRRETAPTDMNRESSRSHAVFIIICEQAELDGGEDGGVDGTNDRVVGDKGGVRLGKGSGAARKDSEFGAANGLNKLTDNIGVIDPRLAEAMKNAGIKQPSGFEINISDNTGDGRSHGPIQSNSLRNVGPNMTLDFDLKQVKGKKDNEIIKIGKLNLVDLAGSERQDKTRNTGDRFEEQRHINKSLTTLGIVIQKLSEKKTPQQLKQGNVHIPYRNSKLTRILQDSLGGNCKTTFVGTVTPSHEHFSESLSTLQFATRVKQIKNTPIVNESTDGMDQEALLRKYEKELAKLRSELEKLRGESGSYSKTSKLSADGLGLGGAEAMHALLAEGQEVNQSGKSIQLQQLELLRQQAEADKEKMEMELEEKNKEYFERRKERRTLEKRIAVLEGRLLTGGCAIYEGDTSGELDGMGSSGGTNELRRALAREQAVIHKQYELKIKELEEERLRITQRKEEGAEQVGGDDGTFGVSVNGGAERRSQRSGSAGSNSFQELLMKQRKIMISLTAKLNEKDEAVQAMQEDLLYYDSHERHLSDKVSERTKQICWLERRLKELGVIDKSVVIMTRAYNDISLKQRALGEGVAGGLRWDVSGASGFGEENMFTNIYGDEMTGGEGAAVSANTGNNNNSGRRSAHAKQPAEEECYENFAVAEEYLKACGMDGIWDSDEGSPGTQGVFYDDGSGFGTNGITAQLVTDSSGNALSGGEGSVTDSSFDSDYSNPNGNIGNINTVTSTPQGRGAAQQGMWRAANGPGSAFPQAANNQPRVLTVAEKLEELQQLIRLKDKEIQELRKVKSIVDTGGQGQRKQLTSSQLNALWCIVDGELKEIIDGEVERAVASGTIKGSTNQEDGDSNRGLYTTDTHTPRRQGMVDTTMTDEQKRDKVALASKEKDALFIIFNNKMKVLADAMLNIANNNMLASKSFTDRMKTLKQLVDASLKALQKSTI